MRGIAWCLLPFLAACSGGVDRVNTERGSQLFHGQVGLSASIRGHASGLPVDAVRCVNCHAMPVALSARSVAGSASVPVSLGPDIFGERLTSAHSRRGGPPSRYGAVDLCRALRKGIDPAQVTGALGLPHP